MSIGSKIRLLRMKRGLTQKELGVKLGFKESSADVRVAHYESDLRSPREDMLNRIADALNVNVGYLNPDTRTAIGTMQALFEMEDNGLFYPEKVNGEPVLLFGQKDCSDTALAIQLFMHQWTDKAEQLRNGEITQEEYDEWRYHFPELKGEQHVIR